jgi:hypothetical protein
VLALALAASLENQLVAQAQGRLDAIAIGDKTPWERDLDPAALLVDEEGNVTTKREFLTALKPLPKGSSGTLHIIRTNFSRTGDIAILAYVADENEAIYAQHFHADFALTDTYRRSGDRWLLVSEQTARLAQDPPAVTPTLAQMQSVAGNYKMVGGPTIFTVTVVNGELFGGRAGTKPGRMYAIADASGQYFRKHYPETLIFVPGLDGQAEKLIDRRYYNRDMIYERASSP